MDAMTAKVRQLRERYEREGYTVIEQPSPDEIPFETGYFARYRPAMLALREDESIVFEIRDARRMSVTKLIERSDEIRKHPGWKFYLVSTEDVVPRDAPGDQGQPPRWGWLEERTEAALRLGRQDRSGFALLALWATLEGVLRRIAVDNGIPVDLLPGSTLIAALYDQGLLPYDSYQPLQDAGAVHRRVTHGYRACPANHFSMGRGAPVAATLVVWATDVS
jgi:hypothetical protein